MNPLTLPDPIANYFAADRRDADAVARCFTPRAVVKDEGRTYTGRDAIKAWKAEVSSKFTYTSEPLSLEREDGAHVVTSRISGDFPGSPVDLQFRFGLESGLIASLEIAA